MYESNSSQLRLMAGTLTAQILSFLSTIVIANLMTPSLYGKYSVSLIFLTSFMPITTKKVETYLVNAKIEHVNAILKSAINRIVIFSLIYGIVLCGIANSFWQMKFLEIVAYGLGIFFTNIIINLAVLAISLSLRTRNFLSIAMSGIWQNGLTLLIQALLLQFSTSIETLIYGYLFGRSLALCIFFAWSDFRNTVKIILTTKNRIGNIEPKVRRDIYLASVLDQITLNSPLIIALLLNNQNLLGISSLALGIALAPATLIISGFSMPFLALGNELYQEKKPHLRNNFLALSGLSSLYLLFTFVFSFIIADKIFGEKWIESVNLIQYFAIPISAYVIISPYLQFKLGLGEVKALRISNIGGILGVGCVIILFSGYSADLIVKLVLFGKVFGQAIPLIANYVKGKKPKS